MNTKNYQGRTVNTTYWLENSKKEAIKNEKTSWEFRPEVAFCISLCRVLRECISSRSDVIEGNNKFRAP